MAHINELIDILNVSFNWNKARITCFAKMLLALLTTPEVKPIAIKAHHRPAISLFVSDPRSTSIAVKLLGYNLI